jgi:hypothetical protein
MYTPDYYTTPDCHPRQAEIDSLYDELDAMYNRMEELEGVDGDMTSEQEDEYEILCREVIAKKLEITAVEEA